MVNVQTASVSNVQRTFSDEYHWGRFFLRHPNFIFMLPGIGGYELTVRDCPDIKSNSQITALGQPTGAGGRNKIQINSRSLDDFKSPRRNTISICEKLPSQKQSGHVVVTHWFSDRDLSLKNRPISRQGQICSSQNGLSSDLKLSSSTKKTGKLLNEHSDEKDIEHRKKSLKTFDSRYSTMTNASYVIPEEEEWSLPSSTNVSLFNQFDFKR